MRSVNKVILIGNLTRDPEMKETQSGQPITTFGIATNREWNTSDSERRKSTEFHEVVAWSKLAEICNNYLRKGKLVYLEGYLITKSWESETGEKRFRTEIVLQDMIMLDKREQSHTSKTEKKEEEVAEVKEEATGTSETTEETSEEELTNVF